MRVNALGRSQLGVFFRFYFIEVILEEDVRYHGACVEGSEKWNEKGKSEGDT